MSIKVSALPTITTALTTDIMIVNASSVTSKMTLGNLINLLNYQPYDTNLVLFATATPTDQALAFMLLGTPTAVSYPKAGPGGNWTYETAAQLRASIDAQQQTTNLDLLSALTVTAFGSSVLTNGGSVAAGYIKNAGDIDQTLQHITPTALAEELRLFLVQPRVVSVADPTSPYAPNVNITDVLDLSAVDSALTIAAPTGSPAKGQRLTIKIKDVNVAQGLTWNAIYHANSTTALPTITVVGKTHYMEFIYNAAGTTSWDSIRVAEVAS